MKRSETAHLRSGSRPWHEESAQVLNQHDVAASLGNPLAKRVWLTTCSHDHPHVLQNYLDRGYSVKNQTEGPANPKRRSVLSAADHVVDGFACNGKPSAPGTADRLSVDPLVNGRLAGQVAEGGKKAVGKP